MQPIHLQLNVFSIKNHTNHLAFLIYIYQEENYPPIANAGEDQIISLDPGDPDPDVTLDGSGSSDADGTIVSYSWTEDGNEIATGAGPTVTFSPGLHEVTLTVTDDDGATDSDEVLVNVIVTGQHWFPPDPSAFYHLIYIYIIKFLLI